VLLEGSNGIHDAYITIALSSPSPQAVTVAYATVDGAAVTNSDYSRRASTISFRPGEQRKVLRVLVKGDTADESDETFGIALSTPVDATIADGTATVTLLDDDPAAAVAADAFVGEGAGGVRYAYFEVRLNGPHTEAVRLRMETVDGTAMAGTDYQGRRDTLTFAAGETRKLVAVAVFGDTLVEPDESFSLVLTPPLGAAVVDAELNALILDDD
jgi:hypothetical protein